MSITAIAAAGGAAKGVLEGVGSVLDELFTSDEERARAKLALEKLANEPFMKELDLAMKQAEHPSVFVAGARPAGLWAAAIGIAITAFTPILNWILALVAAFNGEPLPPVPVLEWEVLMILAGFGGGAHWVRHMDKRHGVARSNLGGQ